MTLPPKTPYCPKCRGTELEVKKKVVGEGIYRRIQTQVWCTDCEEALWLV